MPPTTFNFSPYLPDDAAERLKRYVYRSEDRSPLYNYFWRPLCKATVTMVPVNIAPNVITLTALALVIAVHLGFAWCMPDVTVPLNSSPEATAILSLDAQLELRQFGAPYGSANASKMDAVFGPASAVAAPAFWYWAGAVTLLLYCYLDNLDGHMARRTGMSSPLGLLMDHGCDAVNTVIGSMTIATAVGCGPTWKVWSVVSSAVVVFFMNTWEEYYRGALVLPFINAPNEGLLVAAGLYGASAVLGTSFWLQYLTIPLASVPAPVVSVLGSVSVVLDGTPTTVLDALKVDDGSVGVMLNTLLVIFMTAGALFTSLGNVAEVWRCVRNTKPGDETAHGKYGSGWLLTHFPFCHALTRLLPLFVVTVMANLWVYTSPAEIFREHPRIVCWTFGLLYTKLVTHLMIAHLCEVEFHPLRRTLVPFMYLGLHAVLTVFSRRSDERGLARMLVADEAPVWGDERILIMEFFVLALVTYLHLAVNAVIETASVLGVRILTIPADKQRATLEREAAERKQLKRQA